MEIILDRRLSNDDHRGLGQGVSDNQVTLSLFRFLLEPIIVSIYFVFPPLKFIFEIYNII